MLQRDLDPTLMAEKPPLNPKNSRRRRGRPTREEEMRRGLAELGLDPTLLDPRRVLAEIASDKNAPAGARVAACRTLLGLSEGSAARTVVDDPVSERAIQIMAAARRGH
jgi:hypothetical protein